MSGVDIQITASGGTLYSADIYPSRPTCFVFLVDQSESMNDPFGGGEAKEESKARSVALAMNQLLQTMVLKCARDNGVRRLFDVAVIGYSGTHGVRPVLGGALAGRELIGIDEIALNPIRVVELKKKQSDGAGGLVEVTARLPIWFDPDERGSGGTPMCGTFEAAHAILSSWVAQHPLCYPPTLINLTDGEATDWNRPQDLINLADAIRQLTTHDGNALVYNVHLSSTHAPAIHFPSNGTRLPSPFSKILFDCSSTMPPATVQTASQYGYAATDGARGFVFNAGISDVISFLHIGS